MVEIDDAGDITVDTMDALSSLSSPEKHIARLERPLLRRLWTLPAGELLLVPLRLSSSLSLRASSSILRFENCRSRLQSAMEKLSCKIATITQNAASFCTSQA